MLARSAELTAALGGSENPGQEIVAAADDKWPSLGSSRR
jgi:hypothetical protein